MNESRMSQMTALGADWWNDSGVPDELGAAVKLGAVGGTSNPVIVSQAARANPQLCLPILADLIRENPRATEDELAWKLIHVLGVRSARQLAPVHKASGGRKGYLSMQVNPKYYPNPDLMIAQGLELATLAPNIAIKVPATEPGLSAMTELVARGVSVNATVSFTVAQALEVSDAFARGLARWKNGAPQPLYITLMIGRVDDHLKRVAEAEKIATSPGLLDWAGIAVFKQAHRLFQKGGRPGVLLAAAYRHEGHWSQIIGREVLQTIPYTWWTKFDAATAGPQATLAQPVEAGIVSELREKFPDFVRAYEPDGLKPAEFVHYGPTLHTLSQFLGGYADLVAFVRAAMLT